MTRPSTRRHDLRAPSLLAQLTAWVRRVSTGSADSLARLDVFASDTGTSRGQAGASDARQTSVQLAGLHVFSIDGVRPTEVTGDAEIQNFALYFDGGFETDERGGLRQKSNLALASWLETRVMVVKSTARTRGKHWVLVTPDFLHSNDLRALMESLSGRGIGFEPDFQVICVSQTLLLSIRRGAITGKDESSRRNASDNKAALFEAFVAIIDWAYANGAADVDFRYERLSERSCIGFNIASKWVFPARFVMPSATLLEMIGLAYQFGKGSSESALDLLKEQQLGLFLKLPRAGVEVMLRWAGMAGDAVYSVTTRIIELNRSVQQLSLENLGYLPSQIDILNRAIISDGGMYCLSGVVNSGKSTTLAALLSRVPRTRKILTIEDPVEFMIPGAVCNTVSRPLTGSGSPALTAKLRTVKRTGLNDMLIGEIRDMETGAAAQDVMESGQKLWTTVHADSAWMIPNRLAGQSIRIPRDVLATPGNLRMLGNQKLLPRNCPHCAISLGGLVATTGAHRDMAERLHRMFDLDPTRIRIRNPQGCSHCAKPETPELTGFSGRTCVSELIEPDHDFLSLVGRNDNLGLVDYLQRMKGDVRYDDPIMLGKNSLDCAIYKMSQGEIDPFEIEPRYQTFESLEARSGGRGRAVAQIRQQKGVVHKPMEEMA